VLPDQLQGPGVGGRRVACQRGLVALRLAPAWRTGCLILVPGSGKGSAPAATASGQPPLVVAAVTGA
jgi:hypothetical protein